LNRFLLAFRCFFQIQLHGRLSEDVVEALDLSQAPEASTAPLPASSAAATPSNPVAVVAPTAQSSSEPGARTSTTSDGALQLLAILQRDARLLDFVMEDISGYADDQVGAAVRELHDQCRETISRYIALQPVIDGVEGTFAQAPSSDPDVVKFVGNVPAHPPAGGILRHRGWRAARVDLPAPSGAHDVTLLAPAEIEVE
jgi:hypothetical protein